MGVERLKIYVVDTCAIRELLFHFKRGIIVFDNMWEKLEHMIEIGQVVFVKETFNELDRQTAEVCDEKGWLKRYKQYFLPPNNQECAFVSEIYSHRNFQNNIARRNILEGRPVADPFIIAKAKNIGENAVIVTCEKMAPNAAKIPNMCAEFDIKYINDKLFQKILLED